MRVMHARNNVPGTLLLLLLLHLRRTLDEIMQEDQKRETKQNMS